MRVSLCAGRWRHFHGHEGNETSFDLGVSACQQRPPHAHLTCARLIRFPRPHH